jgi:hypothetical protein
VSDPSAAFGGGAHGRSLVPGSLRGYRTWRRLGRRAHLDDGMLPLTAITRRYVTWGRSMRAQCSNPDVAPRTLRPHIVGPHESPAAWCQCGIYAWYEPYDAALLDAGLLGVFGVIQATGLVLVGESGFRAAQAEIVAVVARKRHIVEACEAAGIVVYRRRKDLLRDYPPEDVSALIAVDDAAIAPPMDMPDDASLPPSGVVTPFNGGTMRWSRPLLALVCVRATLVAVMALVLPLASGTRILH